MVLHRRNNNIDVENDSNSRSTETTMRDRLKPTRYRDLLVCTLFGILLGRASFSVRWGHEDKAEEVNITPSTSKETRKIVNDDNGWNSIGVYYGSDKYLGGEKDRSQCGQDNIVKGLHSQRRGGFFLDLAANDATDLSNTYRLEQELDWHGLCFEPDSYFWPRLALRKCKVVAVVVGATIGEEVDFIMPGKKRKGSGGISSNEFDNKPGRPKAQNTKPVKLFTTTLLDVFQRYDVPRTINYLSLDIEGAEYFVMKNFPFGQYKIEVMTVERPKQSLVDLFYEKGYQYLAANNEYGMETLWVHNSVAPQLDMSIIQKEKWITGTTKYLRVEQDSSKKPTVIYHQK